MIRIRLGFELAYECPQPTPMMLTLRIHPSRAAELETPDRLGTEPVLPAGEYRDGFGNIVHRIVAPAGTLRLFTDTVIRDSGEPDSVAPSARQHAVEDLPDETLVFLLGSRYCETDLLSQAAWDLFGKGPTGWDRVQAICDHVHRHIAFGYQHARRTKTAWEAFGTKTGVCRDFTHLAVAFCRCMNIPARYCTGYLSDIGVPVTDEPNDFAAWFEAYLDGAWHVFDPRNNARRIGRVLIARGRDAADVPLSNTFGVNTLKHFKVWTDPIPGEGDA